MRTHKHITSELERSIVAAALNIFRTFKKDDVTTKSKWIAYMSSIDGGILDTCYIDVETWKLDHIEYPYTKDGKKTETRTIYLSPQGKPIKNI